MRKIRVATLSVPPVETAAGNDYIEPTFRLFAEAGEARADIVVAPEEYDLPARLRGELPDAKGEAIPDGPLSRRAAELASRYGMYVISNIREFAGGRTYNTTSLFGRKGELVGRYRKTHLAPGEEADVTPGDELPVFQCDFGVVGVQVCMDIHYPESWRVLALKGAEVIFHPTMAIDYTGDHIESLVNARAIDNSLYVVTSHFVDVPYLAGRRMGHSRIVDPAGRTRADTGHRPGVALAEIDLDENFEMWYTGELKERYPTLRDAYLSRRRPELYREICEPDTLKLWRRPRRGPA